MTDHDTNREAAGADSADSADTGDSVLESRRKVAHLVSLGQRLGYALFGLFAIIVVVAFITQFPSWTTLAATICLILGCIVLAPAIVFGYAVKAADRADRDHDWR